MKESEWKRASGVVADVLPDYRPIRFGFVRSDEWITAGFYVDSSAFSSAAFYVQAFAMPRFVPAESLYFDYGFRIGRWEQVGPELANAVAGATPKLAKIATVSGLLAIATDWRSNVNQAEVRLCIAVLMRDEGLFDETRRAVDEFVAEVPWEEVVRGRCLALAAVVDDSGFPAGEAILADRREEVDRLLA